MSTARKLPSGSWRCLAYSHTERVLDPKTGKMKDKRIYESFTSDIPGPQGKREAEAAAAMFQLNKNKVNAKKRRETGNMTLTEAIDKYIESREVLQRSPTTIQKYRCTQSYAFQDIMGLKLSELDETILQEAINVEAMRRPFGRNHAKTISAKHGCVRTEEVPKRPGILCGASRDKRPSSGAAAGRNCHADCKRN